MFTPRCNWTRHDSWDNTVIPKILLKTVPVQTELRLLSVTVQLWKRRTKEKESWYSRLYMFYKKNVLNVNHLKCFWPVHDMVSLSFGELSVLYYYVVALGGTVAQWVTLLSLSSKVHIHYCLCLSSLVSFCFQRSILNSSNDSCETKWSFPTHHTYIGPA